MNYGPDDCIKVDVENIALGMFEIIMNSKSESVISFGMVPAEIIKSLEKNIDEKYPTSDLLIGQNYISKDDIEKVKKTIIQDIISSIYCIAKAKKVLVS